MTKPVLTGLPLLAVIQEETGMRTSELIRLEWRDVDVEQGEITIRRETGEERTVRLSEVANGLLMALLSQPIPLPLSPYVFPNRAGRAYALATVSHWFHANGYALAAERRKDWIKRARVDGWDTSLKDILRVMGSERRSPFVH
jgi:integrase